MSSSSSNSIQACPPVVPIASVRQIAGFVYFTFISYLSVGLPLAVLPPYVHLRMGYSAALAGLVISVQYLATFVSRPWTGHICDRSGAKKSVLLGLSMIAISGMVLIAAALLHAIPWLSLSVLVLSRLLLGIGESLGATGATLWGILSMGPSSTGRVLTFNGISSYGGIALGAPVGVALNLQWGLPSIGLVITLVSGLSSLVACRKPSVPVVHGEYLPSCQVLGRIFPHGIALALGGIGYSVLATFITLYFVSRHWSGAALCLTLFGAMFILTRLMLLRVIDIYGGFRVASACLVVESLAMILLWRASASWMAFAGAALAGFGFSFVYPAIGVEVVKRVSLQNRGSALGLFSAFTDVSFFLGGPVAGIIIGALGYSSTFFFALICEVAALVVVFALSRTQESLLVE